MSHRSGDRSFSSANDSILSGRRVRERLAEPMNNLLNGVDGKL
jgi:hypothetical protein